MAEMFDQKRRLRTLCAKCCFTKRMEAVCDQTSYTNHTGFMYEKLVMLDVSCHTASGAAVLDVPGRTQT